MQFSRIFRCLLLLFWFCAVVFPVFGLLLCVFGSLFGMVGDTGGKACFSFFSRGLFALWAVDLGLLVTLLASEKLLQKSN
jgi:hypothetical protein